MTASDLRCETVHRMIVRRPFSMICMGVKHPATRREFLNGV